MLRDALRDVLLFVFGVAFLALALSKMTSGKIAAIAGGMGILCLTAVTTSIVSMVREAQRQI